MLTDLSRLRALKKRLAEASGADPTLMNDLFRALGAIDRRTPKGVDYLAWPDGEPVFPHLSWVSIDAAVALCERALIAVYDSASARARAITKLIREAAAEAWVDDRDISMSQKLARRICLALVRALIAQQEDDHA